MSDPPAPPDPARRRLLDGAIAASACAAAAATAVPAARFAAPPDDPTTTAARATVRRAEVLAAGSKLVAVGGEPVLVVALPGGSLRALSARCTHLGCIVRLAREGAALECPCHGGRFALDGRVLAGPAPAPLAAFEVTERGDEALVARRPAWNG